MYCSTGTVWSGLYGDVCIAESCQYQATLTYQTKYQALPNPTKPYQTKPNQTVPDQPDLYHSAETWPF